MGSCSLQLVGNLDALELVFRLISSNAHLEVRTRALRCVQASKLIVWKLKLRAYPVACAGITRIKSLECRVFSQGQRIFVHVADSCRRQTTMGTRLDSSA
jgi:hypothetical protein